jgi:flagellar basal body-associated protein FliL
MSDVTGVQIYEPPKQSGRGQFVDSVIILALLMVVLFGVTYFVQSTTSATEVKTRPIAELPITQAEKQQFQKLIDQGVTDLDGVNQQVADNRAQPGSKQYPIGVVALIATIIVIAVYLAFVYIMSFKEYREVIRERFGPPDTAGPETSNPEASR